MIFSTNNSYLIFPGSGAACLGHCDGCDMEDGVRNMITAVQKLSLGKPDGR